MDTCRNDQLPVIRQLHASMGEEGGKLTGHVSDSIHTHSQCHQTRAAYQVSPAAGSKVSRRYLARNLTRRRRETETRGALPVCNGASRLRKTTMSGQRGCQNLPRRKYHGRRQTVCPANVAETRGGNSGSCTPEQHASIDRRYYLVY